MSAPIYSSYTVTSKSPAQQLAEEQLRFTKRQAALAREDRLAAVARQQSNYDDFKSTITSKIADDKAAYEEAKAESRARLEAMDAEIQSYRDGYNESWMTNTLANEKAYWDQKTAESMKTVQDQMASMGRVASPYLMSEIKRRMTGQAADALQLRRMELEQERSTYMLNAANLQNDVNKNVNVHVPDANASYALLAELGKGMSGVTAV
jgi:hypothetical protein